MAAMFGQQVWGRVQGLSSRFEGAISRRLERRAETLQTEFTAAEVDQVVRRWLGAAAEELLKDNLETNSPELNGRIDRPS